MSISSRILALGVVCLIAILSACTPPPLERVPVPRPSQQVPVPAPQQAARQPAAPVYPQAQRPPQQQVPVPLPEARQATRPPPQQQPPRQQPAQPIYPQHAASTDPLDSNVYRLANGDVVRVDVLGEAELSLEALLDPSGYISYPFLGRIRANGLTVRELEQQIRSGLMSGYLVNPDVRVSLARYRPIFVSGEVRQAGAYPYSLGLTAGQALTLAGGITTYGSEKRIYLQRWGSSDGRARVELDTRVFPGDTLVVDERLF